MNAQTAKQTSLIAILTQLGAKLDRKTNKVAWYSSPFRNERTASFKEWLNKNTWYDHGERMGVGMKLDKTKIGKVLKSLSFPQARQKDGNRPRGYLIKQKAF